MDRPTIDGQVASMKRAFDARSADPTARAELRQSCIAALQNLQRSCRPQPGAQTSSTK